MICFIPLMLMFIDGLTLLDFFLHLVYFKIELYFSRDHCFSLFNFVLIFYGKAINFCIFTNRYFFKRYFFEDLEFKIVIPQFFNLLYIDLLKFVIYLNQFYYCLIQNLLLNLLLIIILFEALLNSFLDFRFLILYF
jgi:hypothetical protein